MPADIFALDQSGRWTRTFDPLTGTRSESWRVNLLNNDDVVVGDLLGVTGGDFSFNVNAAIRGGGSISYRGTPVDWNRHRVQPVYTASAGTETVEWPVGVFIVATPATEYSDAGKSVSLELYDKTQILEDDKVPSTFQVMKDANVISAVLSVLADAGQTRTAIEESPQTLANGMVWPAGTSRLRIINDLLDAANYFSIWTDGDGIFRTSPYLAPGQRGTAWTFEDNDKSIYSPSFGHDFDMFEVPNRVIVTGQSEGDVEAPISVAEDVGDGPFSYLTRGRWITRVEEGQEATDQATLDSIASRLLQTSQQVGSTFNIKHAPIPLELNSSVAFRRNTESINVNCTVQQVSYSMSTGSLCSTTLREYMT